MTTPKTAACTMAGASPAASASAGNLFQWSCLMQKPAGRKSGGFICGRVRRFHISVRDSMLDYPLTHAITYDERGDGNGEVQPHIRHVVGEHPEQVSVSLHKSEHGHQSVDHPEDPEEPS